MSESTEPPASPSPQEAPRDQATPENVAGSTKLSRIPFFRRIPAGNSLRFSPKGSGDSDDEKDLAARVAKLEGSVSFFSLLFTVLTIILTLVTILLTVLGVFGLVTKGSDFQQASARLDRHDDRLRTLESSPNANSNLPSRMDVAEADLKKISGRLDEMSQGVQNSIVESIEAVFDERESLDVLKMTPNVRGRLQNLRARLKDANSRVAAEDRSEYALIIDAFERYSDLLYDKALDSLNQVKGHESQRFHYLYLKGVCLKNVKKLDEAEQTFAACRKVTNTLAHQRKAENAEGFVKLARFRLSPDPNLLSKAETTFNQLISTAPHFAPAYTNLAIAFALRGPKRYDDVTRTLMLEVANGLRSPETVAKVLADDVIDETEQFFEDYVRQYLGVTAPKSNEPLLVEQISQKLWAKHLAIVPTTAPSP